jgi:hypothetical protein
MTSNEACQISPNLYEGNNPEVLTQVVTGHCQQHEATLIKSGERIRGHRLDKAPHQPKNTLVRICRNLAGFTRFAR